MCKWQIVCILLLDYCRLLCSYVLHILECLMSMYKKLNSLCPYYLLTYLLTYLPSYLFTYLLTHSIEQSPWEVNRFPASQIPCILWNPEVPYCVYECSPPVRILGQISPVHASPLHFLKIHFNVVFHLCQGHSSVLFPSGFHTKTLTAPLLFPVHVTCLTHLILYLITWIIFSD